MQTSVEESSTFLRFFSGKGTLLENFSVWSVNRKGNDKTLLLNYPTNIEPMKGTSDHITPSTEDLPDLSEPFFHIATLNPDDGIRILYSIIFETKYEVKFRGTDRNVDILENKLVVLAIQSKYFHPNVFQSILFHLFNKLPSLEVVKLEDELDVYLHPDYEETLMSTNFTFLPSDLSPKAEIGRFHQFIFSILRPNQILHLLLHLLFGTKIFVTSCFTTQLCFGCFSCLAILYPLNWPNIFITALPIHMIGTAGAPVPFIIGLPFNLFYQPEMMDIEIDSLINLDFANFVMPNEPIIDQDIQTLIKIIENMLIDVLDEFKSTEIFPAHSIQLILWQFIHGVLIISSGCKHCNLNDPNIKVVIPQTI